MFKTNKMQKYTTKNVHILFLCTVYAYGRLDRKAQVCAAGVTMRKESEKERERVVNKANDLGLLYEQLSDNRRYSH